MATLPAWGLTGLLLIAVTIALLWLLPTRYMRTRHPRPISHSSARESAENDAVSVQIVVLGDIGHSPRMQYHAQSIAKHGGQVTIIGYQVSPPSPELVSNPLVSIVSLPPPPKFLQTKNRLFFPVLAVIKALQQTWCLWTALAYHSNPTQWMLVQNPPAIPTLVIARLTCWLRNTQLIIDWHNFGYSILALKLGWTHPMVKVMRHHELALCRYATAHVSVSNAMARILREEAKIKTPILVLHDRPPVLFQPIDGKKERLNFLSSLPETAAFVNAIRAGRRCELLVSSTSWTPDEDFSVLLDALCRYSVHATTMNTSLPELHVIITGKGPQQQIYLQAIASLRAAGKLRGISITCAWLTLQNYAKLLACASLGVCLHTSSSGVDLPMKVVDMFGAGLPVVGWDRYEAWPELVTEGVNGRGFGSAAELSHQLIDLFGENRSSLESLRQGARNESKRRWDDEWDPIAGKLLGLIP
ncbi:mannosyltransferase [Emydomyces testavorans]|uniref:Chitobiosyldiphosphodolichol beta-mannosyltransferase n=1 Tax=Emydomyces testavorans TaxID=2070801 RepID=A0AAF0ILR8_9EURO|nr:mannosyltransferase [Emydomyces testavorans]